MTREFIGATLFDGFFACIAASIFGYWLGRYVEREKRKIAESRAFLDRATARLAPPSAQRRDG